MRQQHSILLFGSIVLSGTLIVFVQYNRLFGQICQLSKANSFQLTSPNYISRNETVHSYEYNVADIISPIKVDFSKDNSSSIAPIYQDPNCIKSCSVVKHREFLYEVFLWWIETAAKHNIVWWLTYGTLLGAMKCHDILPWDKDMDLAVISDFEPVIRKLSVVPPILSRSKVQIVSRPAHHCIVNAPRRNCQGKVVTYHADSCSFCGPLARAFRYQSYRVDLYGARIEFTNGTQMLYDEGVHEYTVTKPLYPHHWVFPLKNCTIMGQIVPCPNKSVQYLKQIYEGQIDYLEYVCDMKTKQWVKRLKSQMNRKRSQVTKKLSKKIKIKTNSTKRQRNIPRKDERGKIKSRNKQ